MVPWVKFLGKKESGKRARNMTLIKTQKQEKSNDKITDDVLLFRTQFENKYNMDFFFFPNSLNCTCEDWKNMPVMHEHEVNEDNQHLFMVPSITYLHHSRSFFLVIQRLNFT